MEPRPQKPTRATGPFISTGTPTPTPGSLGPGGSFGNAPFDASSAPPAPPPAIGYDPDYSPGQPLTPLRGPRGANIIGPLLAVAALAIIVAAVAFIVSQFRGGDSNNDPTATTVAAVVGSPTATQEDDESNADDGEETVTTDDTDATEDPDATSNDDADPTRTPRVNRTEAADDLDATQAADESGDEAPKDRTRARQWFPKEAEVGEGYTQAENGTRDAEGVAASFPDAADAAVQLVEFGWVENAFRNYELADGGSEDTIVITVSIHRFETEGGASDALVYFADGGKTAQGLETVDTEELGEESISLQGVLEGGNVYVIYVRQGNFIFRIGSISPTGDPAPATIAVTEAILEE